MYYKKGDIIEGLNLNLPPDCKIFHAGTAQQEGKVVTHGGRVLAVSALGEDIQRAQTKAYDIAQKISWPNCYYRTDIGYHAIKKSV